MCCMVPKLRAFGCYLEGLHGFECLTSPLPDLPSSCLSGPALNKALKGYQGAQNVYPNLFALLFC